MHASVPYKYQQHLSIHHSLWVKIEVILKDINSSITMRLLHVLVPVLALCVCDALDNYEFTWGTDTAEEVDRHRISWPPIENATKNLHFEYKIFVSNMTKFMFLHTLFIHVNRMHFIIRTLLLIPFSIHSGQSNNSWS